MSGVRKGVEEHCAEQRLDLKGNDTHYTVQGRATKSTELELNGMGSKVQYSGWRLQ